MLTPLKSGLILNSACLLSASALSNIEAHSSKVLSILKVKTEVTEQELRERTIAILDKHQLQYELNWSLSGQPFLTAEGDLVEAAVAAISEVTGIETELSTAGGTSDGRFIAPLGSQVVELGPVNASIHRIDENVSVTELNRLTQIYQNILQRLIA